MGPQVSSRGQSRFASAERRSSRRVGERRRGGRPAVYSVAALPECRPSGTAARLVAMLLPRFHHRPATTRPEEQRGRQQPARAAEPEPRGGRQGAGRPPAALARLALPPGWKSSRNRRTAPCRSSGQAREQQPHRQQPPWRRRPRGWRDGSGEPASSATARCPDSAARSSRPMRASAQPHTLNSRAGLRPPAEACRRSRRPGPAPAPAAGRRLPDRAAPGALQPPSTSPPTHRGAGREARSRTKQASAHGSTWAQAQPSRPARPRPGPPGLPPHGMVWKPAAACET